MKHSNELGDATGFDFRIDDGAYIISPVGRRQDRPADVARAVCASAAAGIYGRLRERDRHLYRRRSLDPSSSNNNIPVCSAGSITSQPPMAYTSPYSYGGWARVEPRQWAVYFGKFAQPPPPPGWVSPDMEKLMRYRWSVPNRPGFVAPYPYSTRRWPRCGILSVGVVPMAGVGRPHWPITISGDRIMSGVCLLMSLMSRKHRRQSGAEPLYSAMIRC